MAAGFRPKSGGGRPVLAATFFCVLALCSLLPGRIWPRYVAAGPERLRNPDFSRGLHAWTRRGRGEARKLAHSGCSEFGPAAPDTCVRLDNDQADQSVGLTQRLELPPHLPALLLFEGRVACKGVRPGPLPWQRARVVLVQRRNGTPRWSLPHHLTAMAGDRPWHTVRAMFLVERDTTRVDVTLQLGRATGAMAAASLSVTEAVPARWVAPWRWSLTAGWILYFAWLFRPCWSNRETGPRASWIPVLVLGMILVGITLPSHAKLTLKQQADRLLTLLPGIGGLFAEPGAQSDGMRLDATKLGHLGGFFLLGAWCGNRLGRGVRGAGTAGVLLATLAMGTELLQNAIPGRTPLWSDVAVDLCGAALGLILAASRALFRNTPATDR